MSEDKTIKGLLERLSNEHFPIEGRVAILTALELKAISKQLTSIAGSLQKIANPMVIIESPDQEVCMNCGMPKADPSWELGWHDFCSDKCLWEMGERLSHKQSCQNCCKTAGDKIKEEGNEE